MDKAALFVYGGQFANGIFTYGGFQVEIGGLTADVWSGVYPSGGTGVPAYAIYSNGQDSLVDITGTSRSNIMGHLYSLEKGTIKVNLNTPDGVLTGLSKTKGTTSDGTTNLSLSNGALWNVAGDSTVTDLSVKSAARGNMTYNTNDQTLTAGHFSGQDGIFYMKSDLASEIHGDKVYITEAEAGSKGFIGVYDKSLATGKAVTDIRHLLMVTDESKNATFSGKDLNTGGLWTIVPTIRRGGTFEDETGNLYGDPEQWYLVTVDKVINEDTVPIITSLDAPYGLYRSLALDTLRQRLGDIRYRNRREDRYDFWVRNRNGHFEGQGFDSRYNVFQAGVDTMPDEKSVYGPLVERGIAGPSYEKGSGKNHTLAAALYGTWLGDRGDYTDVVAKIGRNDTTLHTYGPYADTASYRENEKSLSVEYGRTVPLGDHGYFVEPEVQFVWGYIGSTS